MERAHEIHPSSNRTIRQRLQELLAWYEKEPEAFSTWFRPVLEVARAML